MTLTIPVPGDSIKVKLLKIFFSTAFIFPAMTGVSLLFYVDLPFLSGLSKMLPVFFIGLTSLLNGFLTWILINDRREIKIKYSILAFTLATSILIVIKMLSA